MQKGDTFTHNGIEYTVTEVLNGGHVVSGIGERIISTTDPEGNPTNKTVPAPITIQVADISG